MTFQFLKPYYANYNNFFHPNVCHVCKRLSWNESKLCASCRMISYCNEEHRLLHRKEHEQICKAIGVVNKTRNIWNSYGMTSTQWLIFKKRNIQAIKSILCRKLKPYEEQMFLYAKSCFICRQQNNLTSICGKCYSVNSCINHNLSDRIHKCELLEKTLWMDTYDLEHTPVKIPCSYLPTYISNSYMLGGIEFFIDLCRSPDRFSNIWDALEYQISDYLSKPLTVLYFIKFITLMFNRRRINSFVIHVISGVTTSLCTMSAWELILHTLHKEMELLIVVVGTELQYRHVSLWNVCDMCLTLKKKLRLEYHVMPYERYKECLFYVEPDLIMGFDIEIEEFETNDITTLLNQKCPLVLTTKSQINADNNDMKIKKLTGITKISLKKNSFKSGRPYRDYGDNVFFSNSYISIYNSKCLPNNSSKVNSD